MEASSKRVERDGDATVRAKKAPSRGGFAACWADRQARDALRIDGLSRRARDRVDPMCIEASGALEPFRGDRLEYVAARVVERAGMDRLHARHSQRRIAPEVPRDGGRV